VAEGTVTLDGQPPKAGDGAAVSEEAALDLAATAPVNLVLFDLAREPSPFRGVFVPW
jgi:redox-sensitive bicupin YhaK (pirin superfamily)